MATTGLPWHRIIDLQTLQKQNVFQATDQSVLVLVICMWLKRNQSFYLKYLDWLIAPYPTLHHQDELWCLVYENGHHDLIVKTNTNKTNISQSTPTARAEGSVIGVKDKILPADFSIIYVWFSEDHVEASCCETVSQLDLWVQKLSLSFCVHEKGVGGGSVASRSNCCLDQVVNLDAAALRLSCFNTTFAL